MVGKIASVLIAIVCLAAGVHAETTVDEGLIGRRALVLRYMTATHFEDHMNSIESLLVPRMSALTEQRYPNIPTSVKSAIDSSVGEAIHAFIPKVASRIADLMAAKFSADELEQVVAFYESPVGQKIIAKSGEMVTSVQPLIQELAPGIEADFLHRLCSKIDCSTLPKPAKT